MNPRNERFNRTPQEGFVDYYDDLLFTDMDLFNEKMADWLILYNTTSRFIYEISYTIPFRNKSRVPNVMGKYEGLI